ncbi:tail fiber assembly protein [Providencia alcalifaciens]
MQYFFTGKAFYPETDSFSPLLENDFDNGVWVDQAVYEDFTFKENKGYFVGKNPEGYPCWIEISPEMQKEAEVKQANMIKQSELELARTKIAPLQDALDLSIATSEERTLLEKWKVYRVLLSRIDTHLMSEIQFPVRPE